MNWAPVKAKTNKNLLTSLRIFSNMFRYKVTNYGD